MDFGVFLSNFHKHKIFNWRPRNSKDNNVMGYMTCQEVLLGVGDKGAWHLGRPTCNSDPLLNQPVNRSVASGYNNVIHFGLLCQLPRNT
jgi:hypothetical protein